MGGIQQKLGLNFSFLWSTPTLSGNPESSPGYPHSCVNRVYSLITLFLAVAYTPTVNPFNLAAKNISVFPNEHHLADF